MLRRFHPIIRKWFAETLGKPSDPQRKGWPAISGGKHTLILAPTGTGKTLAAFLWELRSLIRRLGTMGPPAAEEELGARIMRQWLDRYGIVTRECWKRERPPIPWRTIYHELKKMEFRGEARRGYFVRGLAGAQFAAPAAIELLRAIGAEDPSSAPFVVLAASDPTNVYNLPIDAVRGNDLARPRGSGALIVTRAGRVALSVEGRGRRMTIADWIPREEVDQAKELLSRHLRGEKGARYLMLPDIRTS